MPVLNHFPDSPSPFLNDVSNNFMQLEVTFDTDLMVIKCTCLPGCKYLQLS